jgi:hypothetical protein
MVSQTTQLVVTGRDLLSEAGRGREVRAVAQVFELLLSPQSDRHLGWEVGMYIYIYILFYGVPTSESLRSPWVIEMTAKFGHVYGMATTLWTFVKYEESKVKVTLRLSVYLGVEPHLGLMTRY